MYLVYSTIVSPILSPGSEGKKERGQGKDTKGKKNAAPIKSMKPNN